VCRIQSRVCVGGPARHTILLSSRLERQRFRTVLVSGALEPGEQGLMEEARQNEVEVVVVPQMRRRLEPFSDLVSLVRLVGLLRRERPLIVHTHTSKAGALGRLAAWLARVPIIVHTFHGHVFEGYFHPLLTHLFVFVERLLAGITDAIIVLSPAQQADICDRYRIAQRAKVRCIPLGLDLERFIAASAAEEQGGLRRELGLDERSLLIGAVGRLVPVKNHALFLAAARRLVDLVPEQRLEFIIAGDGELRGPLSEMTARLGLDRQVHFLGWRDDLHRIYADLDLLAVTSLNEGTPVSVIEAMAAGLPVVATAVGGVRDILDSYERGSVVHTHDAEEVARVMARMLDEMRDWPRQSHDVDKWSADRLVRDIEELYDDLLRDSRAA
jgi:glycosyltransferase involved in cell wall biosynthesis